MWSFLKDSVISHSINTHGYISMISHLFHDYRENLHSEQFLRLLYKDTPGQRDFLNTAEANTDESKDFTI